MTPFCINFSMNMPYYVAKHIVMFGMRQYILWPLSSYCPSPRVVLSAHSHSIARFQPFCSGFIIIKPTYPAIRMSVSLLRALYCGGIFVLCIRILLGFLA